VSSPANRPEAAAHRARLTPLVAGLLLAMPYGPLLAQPVDNTTTLPDARPGECYAKVITAPRFATRSEEIVVQEASERIEPVPATFETVEERVVVRESSSTIEVTPAEFEADSTQVRVRAAELRWSVGQGDAQRPAGPDTIAAIAASGVDVEAVEPDTCFVEHWREAEYRSELQRVLVRAGSSRIEVTPAVYESVEERVLLKEASTRIVDVPAVFRTETESVLVEPARSVWKPGRGPVERIDDTTGEILCLVELPARYESVSRTVLATPARSETVEVPAVYETVQVQRLVSPATQRSVDIDPEYTTVATRRMINEPSFEWLGDGIAPDGEAQATGRRVCRIERPAEYETVAQQVIASAASAKVVAQPAEFRTFEVEKLVEGASEKRVPIEQRVETVTRQVEIEPSRLEWRPVLCETNMTRDVVADLQEALDREGFEPGPPDGLLGSGTLRAVEAYQQREGLDRGGLTYQTLGALGVDAPGRPVAAAATGEAL